MNKTIDIHVTATLKRKKIITIAILYIKSAIISFLTHFVYTELLLFANLSELY